MNRARAMGAEEPSTAAAMVGRCEAERGVRVPIARPSRSACRSKCERIAAVASDGRSPSDETRERRMKAAQAKRVAGQAVKLSATQETHLVTLYREREHRVSSPKSYSRSAARRFTAHARP